MVRFRTFFNFKQNSRVDINVNIEEGKKWICRETPRTLYKNPVKNKVYHDAITFEFP